VGDVVEITFALKSNGPERLFMPTGTPFPFVGSIDVTVPPGVTALGPDQPAGLGCARKPGSTREFACLLRTVTLNVGESQGGALEVRIDRVIRNATGTVVVHPAATDPNPSNNTAAIVINPGAALPGPGLPVTGARTAT